jgi:hypothetical protein
LDDGKVMDLDGKKWPDAPADDASSYYKVPLLFSISLEEYVLLLWNYFLKIHSEECNKIAVAEIFR